MNLIRKYTLCIVTLVLFLTWIPNNLDGQNRETDSWDFIPGQIVFKIAEVDFYTELNLKAREAGVDAVNSQSTTLQQAEDILKLYDLRDMYRVLQPEAYSELNLERMQKSIGSIGSDILSDDLTRTYLVSFSHEVDPIFLASKIGQIPGVVYAEPLVIMELHDRPNDPLLGNIGQDYFEFQNFFNAWDVTKSSREIIIAIVDSGVDYNHPDLRDNLWRNPDPGRARRMLPNFFTAVENDTIGWNFWESGPANNPVQNNNPMGTGSNHGTHVAGIASAVTDNGIGIASAGYNSTYMAVRAGGTIAEPRSIAYGYQGILYAAVNGAHVINCSFGSTFRSEFANDIVNIATELGSVVVASAGNANNEDPNYPASYENVISVASVSNTSGGKSGFSSFGYNVTVSATGSGILSTVFNNGYGLLSGTSMSAPVVSGLAALVRHQYPDWSPERIHGQIRGTANKAMYQNNPQFPDKLGSGLIDAFKAVSVPVPYIKIKNIAIVNPSGTKLGVEEAGFIEIQIANLGESTTNLTFQIESLNTNVAVLTTTNGSIGSISTGGNGLVRAGVRLDESAISGILPQFKVTFVDETTGYQDFAYFQYDDLLIDTHDANLVRVSFTSNGTIGFNRTAASRGGVGFVPLRNIGGQLVELENVLYEGGIMIEYNTDEVTYLVTNVRETSLPPVQFKPKQLYTVNGNFQRDQEGIARFNTDFVPGLPKLDVEMRTYAFTNSSLNKSVLVYYTLTNNNSTRMAFNDVYLGAFTDWDIGNYSTNSVTWNAADSVQIVKGQTDGSQFFTTAHLGGISSAFAINNAYTGPVDSLNFGIYYSQGSATSIGFTEQYKSWSMKAGTLKTEQTNTDVSLVTASGPFTIRYGQSVTVGFVYSHGENEQDVINQVRAARAASVMTSTPNFNQPRIPVLIPNEFSIVGNYPNPFNPTTNIIVDVGRPGQLTIDLYDVLGRKVTTVFQGFLNNRRHEIPFDARNLAGGTYIVVLNSIAGIETRKIMLVK
jgi:serine protease